VFQSICDQIGWRGLPLTPNGKSVLIAAALTWLVGAAIAARVGCDPAILIAELDAAMRQALLEAVGIPVPFDGEAAPVPATEEEGP